MKIRLRMAAAIVAALAVMVFAGAAQASPQHSSSKHPSESLPPIETSEAENCDFIADPGNSVCMLPFPDDYYTVADPSSATGRRVDFKTAGMPANAYGTHIEAAPYNASDGFSPGSAILVKIPGIETAADVRAMGAVPINHLSQYTSANAPVVVIDAQTGQRWPIWTEIDSTASNASQGRAGDPPGRQLHLRPPLHRRAAAPQERRRRTPRSAGRLPLLPRQRPLRTGSHQRTPPALRRTLLDAAKAPGIQRSNLYLAWDFTVASDANNTSRELSMRNDAFAQLGDTNLADGIPQGVSPSFQRDESRKRTRTPGRSPAG